LNFSLSSFLLLKPNKILFLEKHRWKFILSHKILVFVVFHDSFVCAFKSSCLLPRRTHFFEIYLKWVWKFTIECSDWLNSRNELYKCGLRSNAEIFKFNFSRVSIAFIELALILWVGARIFWGRENNLKNFTFVNKN
jgi:hypothetical protein